MSHRVITFPQRGHDFWPGESEERLAFAIEATSEGIWDWNISTGNVFYSPQWLRLLGYSPEHKIPDSAEFTMSLVHPDDVTRVRRAREAHLVGRTEIAEVEVRLRTGSGNYCWVLDRSKVVAKDRDGRPSRMVGTIADISDRKLTERAMRVMSTELSRVPGKAVFDQLAIQLAAIVGADIGFVGTVRPDPVPTVRTLGFSIDGAAVAQIEYAVSDTPCELVVNGQTAAFPNHVQVMFPRDADLAALGATGYLAAPLLDAAGRVLGLIGVISRSPITDPERSASIVSLFALRSAAEVVRQRAEERFATIFESVPDAVIIANERGQILQTNRAAEEALGYSREEFTRLSIEDLVPPDDRARHAQQRAEFLADPHARRRGSARPRMWAVHRDGHHLPVEINLSPMRLADEDHVVATIRDISSRVQMEDERQKFETRLREVQKMESLGTLAGGIAHDFNNLLTVIMGGLELAKVNLSADHPAAGSLELVATASARANELVQQIRTFSRRHPVSRQSTSLRAMLAEVARLLRASIPAGIQIHTHADEHLPDVHVDPSQMHQVMMNLGTNAWQAIDRSTGRIGLCLDMITVQLDAPRPAAGLAPGRWIRLRVTDDGSGMDQSTVQRMFEPFFTTKPAGKGTGLGLSVVHGIVAEHGGVTAVDSAPLLGTTISVFLPVARTPATASLEPLHTQPGSSRVLLIDDDQEVAHIAADLLTHLGYRVTCHGNACAALEVLRTAPHAFDVVITDQSMPDLCGLDVARAISDLRPDLPVILISGNHTQTDDDLAAANIRGCVAKPFTASSLSRAIELALGPRSPATSS